MKNKKTALIIIAALISIVLLLWLVLGNIYGPPFWQIPLKDWISIVVSIIIGLIGIVIAYKLNEKSTNKRMLLNAYIEKIASLTDTLIACRNSIINDYLKKDFCVTMLSYNKIINNSVDLLSKYSLQMNVDNEFNFIKIQLAEFKVVTTEYTSTLKDDKTREKAVLKINLIINKLDEIYLKQYENL